MARVEEVRSGDARLEPYRALNDPARRRDVEARLGVFVVEGKLAIRRLLTSPYDTISVLVTPARWQDLRADVAVHRLDVLVADRALLAEVAGFDVHRGALALARRPEPLTPALVTASAQALVVCEGLNDHENLGALARTAWALGVDGLLLDPTCADPLARRSVRVSMGEILHLPFARLAPWPEGLRALAASGFTVIALTPADDALPIDAIEPPDRVALVLGAEGPGLTAGAQAAVTLRVRIPIRPTVDSLNVSHAAGIAIDRLVRRRHW
jgi:tRNA G18 (ribose-2'-O)-methylase SpoU